MFSFTASCSNNEASQPDNNNPEIQTSSGTESGDAEKGTVESGDKSPETQKDPEAESGDDSNDTSKPGNNSSETPKSSATASGDAVRDLTILSSTMLSAELVNIRMNLDDYIGKTIKISGVFSAFYYEVTEKFYFNVITYMDATQCCSEGMEFILNGDYEYPDDYPEEGAEIELVGKIDSYEELGVRYCYLAADEMKIK